MYFIPAQRQNRRAGLPKGAGVNMTVLESMRLCGVDTETTLHRFAGNESLLKRFVQKFPQDPTYQSLSEAIKGGDPSLVERSAHTLKGIAANLGYQTLSDRCADLVAAVRQGEYGSNVGLFQNITEEYDKIVNAIGQIA